MDGMVWLYLAQIVAFAVLAVVVVGLRRWPSVAKKSSHCTHCQTPMSMRRVSLLRSLVLLGEWVCPHCGNRIKSSKRGTGTAA
jgi:DNA-directed RNA polymerase subunit RPC12/RpoP